MGSWDVALVTGTVRGVQSAAPCRYLRASLEQPWEVPAAWGPALPVPASQDNSVPGPQMPTHSKLLGQDPPGLWLPRH